MFLARSQSAALLMLASGVIVATSVPFFFRMVSTVIAHLSGVLSHFAHRKRYSCDCHDGRVSPSPPPAPEAVIAGPCVQCAACRSPRSHRAASPAWPATEDVLDVFQRRPARSYWHLSPVGQRRQPSLTPTRVHEGHIGLICNKFHRSSPPCHPPSPERRNGIWPPPTPRLAVLRGFEKAKEHVGRARL